VRPSMGSVGDAYDNAMCESLFATLEAELLERRRFASKPRPAWPALVLSRADTTRPACTPAWAIVRPSPTKQRCR